MADFQIGDNLYANDAGKYWNIVDGSYKDASGNTLYGRHKSWVDSPYDTAQKRINEIYNTQQTSQLNALKTQRDKAIQGFNQQKKDLAPQYQAQRNQADVTNAQNVTRLRELMAANGINMSGENITAQANMNSARQNAFNDINNNQNQAYASIDRQIADANDPSKEQAINDAIAAERSKALADAFTQAQQQAYQQQLDWRNYAMQKAQFDLEQKARELQLQQALAKSSGGSSGSGGSRGGGSSGSTTTPSAVPKAVQEQANAYAKWFSPSKQSQNMTYSTNGITRQAGY